MRRIVCGMFLLLFARSKMCRCADEPFYLALGPRFAQMPSPPGLDLQDRDTIDQGISYPQSGFGFVFGNVTNNGA